MHFHIGFQINISKNALLYFFLFFLFEIHFRISPTMTTCDVSESLLWSPITMQQQTRTL